MKMPFPKPHTYRSKKYLAYIRTKKCLICGNPETVPHHEGLGLNMMGGKSPDSHCLPLCFKHHARRHSYGASIFWDSHPYIDVKFEIIKLLTEYLEQLEE